MLNKLVKRLEINISININTFEVDRINKNKIAREKLPLKRRTCEKVHQGIYHLKITTIKPFSLELILLEVFDHGDCGFIIHG